MQATTLLGVGEEAAEEDCIKRWLQDAQGSYSLPAHSEHNSSRFPHFLNI